MATVYIRVRSVENRAEWLEWRRQGIGSSDAPAIMTGAWVWRVWLSKVGGDDGGDNNSMRRGRYLERGVAQWAADELGVTLSDAGRVVLSAPVQGVLDALYPRLPNDDREWSQRWLRGEDLPLQGGVGCRG